MNSSALAFVRARVFEKRALIDLKELIIVNEPDGFRKFCGDIRVPKMMKRKNKSSLGKEKVFKLVNQLFTK